MNSQGKKVVFQKWRRQEGRYDFPYPPVYCEEDTDYICFTDDCRVTSGNWEIVHVEELEMANLETYLGQYSMRYELKQDEIQMGPVWAGQSPEDTNVVKVPKLEDLPELYFDRAGFVPTADENGNYSYRENPVYHDGDYEGRPLLLTIGVPVSNQIDTIERCLGGVKPLLDRLDAELVVINTGSTDGTLDVCRRYGARIVEHLWHDNMSAVRNEGIYHAKGLWYMSIDDDEWFEDVSDILEFFRQGTYRDYDRASYIQRNYIVSDGSRFEDSHTPRLARITPTLHFEGRIHDAMVNPDERHLAMLPAVAYHYGFVNDRPELAQKKFQRNISILVYDVYEYPKNLRYLFQMANEYNHMTDRSTAIQLFSQVIALEKELGGTGYGKKCVPCLMADLFHMGDVRLFTWPDYLMEQFPLTHAGHAAVAWYQARIAAAQKQPAERVLEYYREYRKMSEEHWKNPAESRSSTFHGLSLVEHDFYMMLAEAVAFWSCLDLGREDEALDHLKKISLEVIGEKRAAVLESGLGAGDVIFGELCGRLTPVQWEQWAGEILDAFAAGLDADDTCERQLARIPMVFGHVSVPAVTSWAKRHEGGNKGKPGRRLVEYALGLDIGHASIQELCMASWMLKEEGVNQHGTPEAAPVIKQYILTTGAFAAGFYNRELLLDEQGHIIGSEIRTAYRIAMALRDGEADDDNTALAEQVSAVFPMFQEEIGRMLL